METNMLVVHRPQISFEASDDVNFARVSIEPLEPGFGYTLGNSLRRTLISSIPGAAVTALKIQGVQHEFSTIPGVKEDVTDIILNIKQLVLRSESQEGAVIRLNVSGPADVTGADIELPSGIEVLNPQLHICTINKRARLEVEMMVSVGRGYVSSDRNKPEDAAIGLIPIDSIFSPVRRVTYSVEPTRVEQKTDYDRLIVDIETNGGLTPKEALSASGRTLVELFSLFAELGEGPGLLLGPEPGAQNEGTDLGLPIEEMDFSVRSYNCLKREGVTNIGQLVEKSEQDLLDIRNFGQKSIDEVKQKLAELNLGLKQRNQG